MVITGVVKVFSAGGNLKNVQGDTYDAFVTRKRLKQIHQLLHLIRNVEKPIIASRSAFFIQSFVKVGALPDFGALHFLTQIVGPHRAKQLMMLGDRISAEQAFQLGMINEVVDDDELIDRANSIANTLAEGPSLLIGLIKQLVNRSTNVTLEDFLEIERADKAYAFKQRM
ncbi:hypothetical protein EMIT07CA2_20634 [Brevibacillus sp. IT-7CA2]|uniref:enoyl-CoA hydratase/isomerase family protein n=1 Tax=Brevibacillus sp. IT-7CA2 TaxID=3026436 RepID=UPI0039E09267